MNISGLFLYYICKSNKLIMEYLTESYLESLGFSISWAKEHGYHTQYTKHDEGVNHAIILVSRTSVVDSVRMEDDTPEIFDVWIWGPTTDGDYKEVETKMSLSTTEELSVLLDYLKY